MINSDAIWSRARADLIVTDERGQQDTYLWEHSQRVARCAQHIAILPAVQSLKPDEGAVLAAALYHDAGWAVRSKEGTIPRTQILNRPSTEAHRALGASLMEKQLESLLSPESMRRASRAVRSLNERDIEVLEGQIVTDAENLNEVGLLSLWPIIRRGVEDGKDVESVIKTWRRQKEFHFWEARLKDSFHFEPVRQLAQARLDGFERFMQQLTEQHAASDLTSLVEEVAPDRGILPTRR